MPVAKLFYQNIIWKGVFFLSSFIVTVLIARHFQASVSGQLFYLVNLYAFIILVLSLSLESAMGYFIARNEISLTRVINFCFAWTLLIAFGIIAFALLKNKMVFTKTDALAFAFICGNLLSGYGSAIAYAKRNFFLPNIINTAINIFLIFLLVFMEAMRPQIINDDTFMVIFFSIALLQGIITLLTLNLLYIKSWSLSLPTVAEGKKLFRYGLVAFAANIISFLLYRVDYWFVKHYCTADDLGNYIQVSKLAQVFFILPGMLAGAVFPLTAGGQQRGVISILASVSRVIFVLYLFCCGVLAATGYWLFPFIFGHTFQGMYLPFLFLVPGIVALSTLYTLTAYFAGKNKISVNIKGALAGLACIISGDLLLIPLYGINAAAMVSSMGYIVYHIYVLHAFTKEYGQPAISFFNFSLSDIQKIKRSIFKK